MAEYRVVFDAELTLRRRRGLQANGTVPITGARLLAAPRRVKALGTFPAPAYAIVPSEV